MKRFFLILLLVVFCNGIVLCQSNRDTSKIKIDTGVLREYSAIDNPGAGEYAPYIKCDSGIWRSYYSNGKVMAEGRMLMKRKEMVEDGIWKLYYKDGSLMQTEEYRKGKLIKIW